MKESKPDCVADKFFPAETDASPISTSATITVTCGATEHLGNVKITGTCEPVSPDYIQVCLYANKFPDNPNHDYLSYFYINNKGDGKGPTSKQTSQPWGSGYYVGVSCKDQNGDWQYICKVGPT